jgi:hypothetical protein
MMIPILLFLKLICFGECTGITIVDSRHRSTINFPSALAAYCFFDKKPAIRFEREKSDGRVFRSRKAGDSAVRRPGILPCEGRGLCCAKAGDLAARRPEILPCEVRGSCRAKAGDLAVRRPEILPCEGFFSGCPVSKFCRILHAVYL